MKRKADQISKKTEKEEKEKKEYDSEEEDKALENINIEESDSEEEEENDNDSESDNENEYEIVQIKRDEENVILNQILKFWNLIFIYIWIFYITFQLSLIIK